MHAYGSEPGLMVLAAVAWLPAATATKEPAMTDSRTALFAATSYFEAPEINHCAIRTPAIAACLTRVAVDEIKRLD